MVFEGQLAHTGDEWQARIAELQAQLEEIKPQLISAETLLADRLAAISAFEFRLRARLSPLTRRLETLEAEIDKLRRKMRHLQDAWLFDDDLMAGYERRRQAAWEFEQRSAASEGSYRYRERIQTAPQTQLTGDEAEVLKQLYRRLARRFHPDFALDEEDRAYRTQLMMAINAAYSAADLARLERIAAEPERIAPLNYTDKELAAALWKELVQCRRRLHEIEKELARLKHHQSSVLMVRVEDAKAKGVDLLGEMERGLHDDIARKLAQRDILQAELDAFLAGESNVASDELADTLYDLGLEEIFVEESRSAFSEWRERHAHHFETGEGEDEEEAWRSIRKATKRTHRK